MSGRALFAGLLGVAAIVKLIACNSVLGISHEPTLTNADASDRWACVDDPAEGTSATATVAVGFRVSNALTAETTGGTAGESDFTVLAFTPLPGITMEPCTGLDINCASPVLPAVVSNDAGIAVFTMPQDFHGFFLMSGSGDLTTRLYTDQFALDASVFNPPAQLITAQEANLINDTLGTTLSPNSGQVIFSIYDCFDRVAPGVVFSIEGDAGPGITPFYYVDSFPNPTATETDDNGVGGAVNVPPGAWTVTASLAGSNRLLRTRSIYVAAGQVTTAWFRTSTH